MTDGNRMLIHIPKGGGYIEILGYKIDGFDSFESFCEHLKKYAEMEDEITRQKAEIERLNEYINRCKSGEEYWVKCLLERPNEAIKEFAERLKKGKYIAKDDKEGELHILIELDVFDNLVKEMVGDDK